MSWSVAPSHPRDSNPRPALYDRAEEQDYDELGKAAFHGNILRHIFPSPAAFGTTDPGSAPGMSAQVVAAFDAVAALAADHSACSERTKCQQPQDCGVEQCVDREAGPDGAKRYDP